MMSMTDTITNLDFFSVSTFVAADDSVIESLTNTDI